MKLEKWWSGMRSFLVEAVRVEQNASIPAYDGYFMAPVLPVQLSERQEAGHGDEGFNTRH